MARKTVIGLDIGTSAVRAAELDLRKSLPVLARFGQVMLPVGAVRDGEIVDEVAVGNTLAELWKRAGLKSKRVLTGVANQRVIVRQIEMPYMETDELREGLAFQVQDQLPIPVEDAILDFRVLGEFAGENGERNMRVLLVAAQREMVDTLVRALGSAGIQPDVIDLIPFALMRTLGLQIEAVAGDPSMSAGLGSEAIVDVGAGITNIVVHENGAPRFVRILVGGGKELTDALATALGTSIDEAELIKRQASLGGASDDTEGVIEDRMQAVIEEIKGSLEYFENQSDSTALTRLVVSGGGSQAPNFVDRLAAAVGVPTELGHPLAAVRLGKLGLSPEQLAEAEPLISVPVGLALGEGQ